MDLMGMRINRPRQRVAWTIGLLVGAGIGLGILVAAFDVPVTVTMLGALAYALVVVWLPRRSSHRRQHRQPL